MKRLVVAFLFLIVLGTTGFGTEASPQNASVQSNNEKVVQKGLPQKKSSPASTTNRKVNKSWNSKVDQVFRCILHVPCSAFLLVGLGIFEIWHLMKYGKFGYPDWLP